MVCVFGIAVQLGEIQDPASGRAVQVRHVDVQGVNLLVSEDRFRFCARRQRRKIRWTRPLGLPSGEAETRAARFPCGGCTGAAGPGFAESAIKAFGAPLAAVSCVAPTSGAGPASPDCVFCASRGAAPALISSLGLAGPLCAAGRLMSATCCSMLGMS